DKVVDLWNNGNMTVAEEIYAPDFKRISPMGTTTGIDEFKAGYDSMKKVYSDVKLTINDYWAKGDKVTVLWNFSATNTGPFAENMPATGKAFSNDGVSILTLKDGKIVNDWAAWDQLSIFTELGYTLQPPQMAEAETPAENATE
ncbi:MAG: ester cyclase, partial [Saprospiraceae bacterium]